MSCVLVLLHLDCELYAPEFLVVMLPFLLATAVMSAVS